VDYCTCPWIGVNHKTCQLSLVIRHLSLVTGAGGFFPELPSAQSAYVGIRLTQVATTNGVLGEADG